MTQRIQQIYSGKVFTVIHEDAEGYTCRPIPDDRGPDVMVNRQMFEQRWRVFKGVPDARAPHDFGKQWTKAGPTDLANRISAAPKPERKTKKRRGR